MKKKTLLLTTLAGTMFVAGLTMTNVNAAVAEKAQAKMGINLPVNGASSVLVELINGETELTEADIRELVNAKYADKNIKVANVETTEEGLVGTGATVTLSTGKKITVVLYGDVTEDGKLDMKDAYKVFKSKYGLSELNDAEKVAANVALAGDSLADAYRIFNYQHYKADYERKEYADNFDEYIEKMPETMNVTATKVTAAGVEATEVDVTDAGETVVKVKVNGMNVGEARPQYSGKWVKVSLTTNATDWAVKEEGTNYEVVLDEETEKTESVLVWVKVEENSEVKVPLVNNNSEEEMVVALKIVDVTMPTVSEAGLEVDDMAEVEENKITPSMNANVMEETTRNGVSGKWYALNLVTDMPAEKIEVVEVEVADEKVKTDEDGKPVVLATKYDVLPGTATDLDEGEYSVVVWLDASKPVTNLVFKNIEATDNQVKSATPIEVTVENAGEIKISSVTEGSLTEDASSALYSNMEAIETIEPEEDFKYTITVNGSLKNMKPFLFGTKADGTIDYSKIIAKDDEGYVATEAKKYYVLVIDTGYNTEHISGDNVITDLEIIKLFNSAAVTEQNTSTSIVLVLDAEKEETSFTLTNAFNPNNNETQESFTFTVKFADVSTPTLVSARELVDNGAITSVTVNASTVAVSALKASTTMDETTRVVSGEEVTGLWYQLVVDTGVKNTELLVDGKEADTDEVSKDTEIVIWVNGSEISTSFEITNKNDNTKKLELKVNTNNISTVSLGNVSGASQTLIADTHKETIKQILGNSATDEDVKNAINNNKYTVIGSANQAGIANNLYNTDKTYKIQLNLNALNTFELYGEEGKWFPLVLNIGNNANIANNSYGTNGYLDVINIQNFTSSANYSNSVVLWVNADKLNSLEKDAVTEEDALAFDIEIPNNKYGVNEKLTARFIILKDTSTFKNTGSKELVNEGYEVTKENITSHSAESHFTGWGDKAKANATQYYINQKLISDVSTVRNGNVVTVNVKGDFVRMGQLTNNVGGVGRLVTLKLDLGTEVVGKLQWRYSKVINGSEITWNDDDFMDVSEDGRDAYECKNTEDYLNDVVTWTGEKTEGVIFTRIVEYKSKDVANGDVLRFVINYEQVGITDAEYKTVKDTVDALVKE